VAVIKFGEVNNKLKPQRKKVEDEALLCSTEAYSLGDGKHHDKEYNCGQSCDYPATKNID
jgi:hypothetical protein